MSQEHGLIDRGGIIAAAKGQISGRYGCRRSRGTVVTNQIVGYLTVLVVATMRRLIGELIVGTITIAVVVAVVVVAASRVGHDMMSMMMMMMKSVV